MNSAIVLTLGLAIGVGMAMGLGDSIAFGTECGALSITELRLNSDGVPPGELALVPDWGVLHSRKSGRGSPSMSSFMVWLERGEQEVEVRLWRK
jgi:hypothetical protein